jgi:predicted ATPase/transcriptional regulator with XRE-family HTH domain
VATEARWDVTEAGKQQAHSVPSFGQLLRRYRTLARLTQEELAERSGYSTDYIGKLERDQRQPPLIAVDRLVAVFALGETEHERLLAARERHGTSHLPAQPPSPSSLPSAPTPLIGRVAERAAVHAALDASRLVTLTGVGGTGKTRLALQVAERLLDAFPDGVYFVSLTSVPDASLVPSAIAGTLGLHEAGRQAPFDALQEHLRDKHLLLVLDGFEHLLEAAPLIGELLAGCPELRILVTSRAVLHLAAEQVYPVPPLSLPDLQPLPETADLAHYDAVALFLARAQAVRSDFTLTAEDAPAVAEICHRLDGLPLAIELAAARVRLFLPPALLERLSSPLGILTGGARDLPARQQTLRGTLDWSYGLLSNGEQRLFRRLAVFAGGCTLQAAEVVCNREEDLDVVETVSSLLDQSLLCPAEVTSEEPRVVMLQTIREYALEQLEESGEVEALRRRHADYYLALAEKAEPALLGAGQTTWLSHLEQEHGNLRAALRWCLRPGEAERGLRLGAALWRFYQARGHLTEGREWLEGLLRLQESSGSSGAALVRARALVSASRLARAQGDIARAATLAEEGLELSRQLRDKDTGAGALITLGHAALVWGDIRRAEDCCQEALALAQETGNTWSIAEALHHLGTQAMGQGEYDRAVSLYEQSLVLWRECGDGVYLGATLIKLGDLASYFEGDRNKAARLYGESVAVFRDLADRRGTGHALAALADLAQEQGDFERAEALAAESLQLLRDLGERHITAWATQVLADVVLKQGDAMRALALLRQSLVLAQSVGHTDIVASMLGDLGRVAWAQARPARAACLCGAAAALRAAVGTTILPQQQGVYDRLLADVRQALGEGACDLAWDRGRAMPMEQAITYALQDAVD